MKGIDILINHLWWLVGIILAGGVVGIIAAMNGATQKDAKFYMGMTSAILLVIYLFVRFR